MFTGLESGIPNATALPPPNDPSPTSCQLQGVLGNTSISKGRGRLTERVLSDASSQRSLLRLCW